MTAKEKSLELVDRFINVEYLIDFQGMTLELAKQCALITVDEIIKQLVPIEKAPNNKSAFQYWEEVKQEIELL